VNLYFASGNVHKAAELQSLADHSGVFVRIISARAIGGMPQVVEDTGTFVGNARKKALALRAKVSADAWTLADDSGLCVEALAGAPGVESAYYAGAQSDADANLAKLIMVMQDVPSARRAAHFTCVLFLVGPCGSEHVFEGRCDGNLLLSPRGEAGFGYDPLFVPAGHTESFAQLGDGVKNTISHRARAWTKLAEWVKCHADTRR
jgi:XTP/dITP diphosphohydrolase